jgi:hypothetical protein
MLELGDVGFDWGFWVFLTALFGANLGAFWR